MNLKTNIESLSNPLGESDGHLPMIEKGVKPWENVSLTVSLAKLQAFQAEVVNHGLAWTHRAGDAVAQTGDLHVAGVGAAGLVMRLRAGEFYRRSSFRSGEDVVGSSAVSLCLSVSLSLSLSLSGGVASANRHTRCAAWAVLRRPESHVMMRRETA